MFKSKHQGPKGEFSTDDRWKGCSNSHVLFAADKTLIINVDVLTEGCLFTLVPTGVRRSAVKALPPIQVKAKKR
jgi:hypothetical protein